MRKNIIRFIESIFLFAFFFSLIFSKYASGTVHEILGLFFGALIVIHLLLNKGIFKTISSGRFVRKPFVIVDILLGISAIGTLEE
ncbi:MAG: hypothetical protein WCQ94_06200 [Lachnospiraceae bacterium]|nr:hypothetical protein [Lachnospiraceae bacterium]MDD4524893.1 hypothetical protein [Lachnospiraceae bacterium]